MLSKLNSGSTLKSQTYLDAVFQVPSFSRKRKCGTRRGCTVAGAGLCKWAAVDWIDAASFCVRSGTLAVERRAGGRRESGNRRQTTSLSLDPQHHNMASKCPKCDKTVYFGEWWLFFFFISTQVLKLLLGHDGGPARFTKKGSGVLCFWGSAPFLWCYSALIWKCT